VTLFIELFTRSLTQSYKSSKTIDEFLKKEKQDFDLTRKEPKLLILGNADSGKSTLLKQLKIMHNNGFNNEEKVEARSAILAGISFALVSLYNQCTEKQQEVLNEKYSTALDFVEGYTIGCEEEFPSFKSDIEALWRNPYISSAFKAQDALPDTTD
jgi:guanine nucleotide-binding protein G(i) subunit alpha